MDTIIAFVCGAFMGAIAGLIIACIILVLHNGEDIL